MYIDEPKEKNILILTLNKENFKSEKKIILLEEIDYIDLYNYEKEILLYHFNDDSILSIINNLINDKIFEKIYLSNYFYHPETISVKEKINLNFLSKKINYYGIKYLLDHYSIILYDDSNYKFYLEKAFNVKSKNNYLYLQNNNSKLLFINNSTNIIYFKNYLNYQFNNNYTPNLLINKNDLILLLKNIKDFGINTSIYSILNQLKFNNPFFKLLISILFDDNYIQKYYQDGFNIYYTLSLNGHHFYSNLKYVNNFNYFIDNIFII
jgi:hypothetical protein